MIEEMKPDIIGLTEVWMKEHYSIKGFHPAFRHDREESRKGGGIMLFVRENLVVSECTELNAESFEEALWVTVKMARAENMLIGICYRSPNSTRENNEKLIDLLQHRNVVKNRNVLIMGDFNFSSICWEDGVVDGLEDCEAARFFDVTQNAFLYQHVNTDTRYREGHTPSRLDLVFTSREYLVNELEPSHPLGKSDHIVLTWKCVYKQTIDHARIGKKR